MTEAAICIYFFSDLLKNYGHFLLPSHFDDLNRTPQFLGWNDSEIPDDATFYGIGSCLYAFGGCDINLKTLTKIYSLNITEHGNRWKKCSFPMLRGRFLPHILLIGNKIVLFDSKIFDSPPAPFGEIHDVSMCWPAYPVMPPPSSIPLEGSFLIAPMISSNQVLLVWAKSGKGFLYDLGSLTWKVFHHTFDFKHYPAWGQAIFVRNDTTLCWYIHGWCGLYFYDIFETTVSWRPIVGWKDPVLDSDMRTESLIFPHDHNHIIVMWGEDAYDGNFVRCSKIQLIDDTNDNGDPFIVCLVVSSQRYSFGEQTDFTSACHFDRMVFSRNSLVEKEESSSLVEREENS